MMSPLLMQLSALAFHRGTQGDANRAIAQAREIYSARNTEGVSYEVVLPPLGQDDFLCQKVLPKLVYFLDCRGIKPPNSGNVFVSLFGEEGLLFVEAGKLIEALSHARGLTLAEVVRRYGTEGAGDPLLLGPS